MSDDNCPCFGRDAQSPHRSRCELVLGRSKLTKARFESGEQPWFAIAQSISGAGELCVIIQGKFCSHVEWWNLAHTLAGIRSRFYQHEILPEEAVP